QRARARKSDVLAAHLRVAVLAGRVGVVVRALRLPRRPILHILRVMVEPRTMKAAILAAQKSELVLGEVELPERLEQGKVLVLLEYSGICGSQVGEIDGVKGADPHLPHLLGHEGSATVAAVG